MTAKLFTLVLIVPATITVMTAVLVAGAFGTPISSRRKPSAGVPA